MMRASAQILSLALFASCTAINQKDAFLDSLPRPVDNLLFSDDFENGLAKWNQINGSWTTTTIAANGLALVSPTGASATTFSLSTLNTIDLSGRTGCFLEYDAAFLLGSSAGTGAQILFGTTTVADFKQPAATTTMTSSGIYRRLRVGLASNSNGRLTIQTTILNGTAAGSADLKLDNLRITCGNATNAAVAIVDETFEASAANWTTSGTGTFSRTSGQGVGASYAMYFAQADNDGYKYATYVPSVDLSNRQGCQISYYYKVMLNTASSYMELLWNSNRVTYYDGGGGTSQAGTARFPLTAFEGTSGNTLAFRCSDSCCGGQIGCTIDNVQLICEK